MDVNKVMDCEKAILHLGGEQLFKLMVPMYESTSLLPYLEKMAAEINKQSWDQVSFFAHALKGPAVYIGGSRVHFACYYMQRAHLEGDLDLMLEYYSVLITEVIELRYHIDRYILEHGIMPQSPQGMVLFL